MTTSAFTHLIAINPPTQSERTSPVNATTLEVNRHIEQLQQVATDLRNERTLSASKSAGPNRVRLAIGSALVSLGSAVAGPGAPRAWLLAR
jgi:hypothetical protein